jgi:glycogen operon protein
LNPGAEDTVFQMPSPALAWIRELDSATQAPAAPLADAAVTVAARSVALLAATYVPGDPP